MKSERQARWENILDSYRNVKTGGRGAADTIRRFEHLNSLELCLLSDKLKRISAEAKEDSEANEYPLRGKAYSARYTLLIVAGLADTVRHAKEAKYSVNLRACVEGERLRDYAKTGHRLLQNSDYQNSTLSALIGGRAEDGYPDGIAGAHSVTHMAVKGALERGGYSTATPRRNKLAHASCVIKFANHIGGLMETATRFSS